MADISPFFQPNALLSQVQAVWRLGAVADAAFEEKYLAVRKAEGRLLTDEQVSKLPESPHPSKQKEWAFRQQTFTRVLQSPKAISGTVLDVGCGNGWFTHCLAQRANVIIGVDVNGMELEQAARVFEKDNLSFLQADLFDEHWKQEQFDHIYFNSCIQYFSSLSEVLNRALELLVPGGKIQVLDSPFYAVNAVKEAAQRSKKYYTELGFPEMADHYFHHTWEELRRFQPTYPYRPPTGFLKRLQKHRSPFPWVTIEKR